MATAAVGIRFPQNGIYSDVSRMISGIRAGIKAMEHPDFANVRRIFQDFMKQIKREELTKTLCEKLQQSPGEAMAFLQSLSPDERFLIDELRDPSKTKYETIVRLSKSLDLTSLRWKGVRIEGMNLIKFLRQG